MELAGATVLVLGLGRSGVAAARLLLARGARVVAHDARPEAELPEAARALRERGVELSCGPDPGRFRGVDQVVVSPGVPRLPPGLDLAARAGVPIASEVELASWFLAGLLVGITGTNGKSTVTTLVGEMCRRSGRPTFVGGNLGTPLCEAVGTAAAESSGCVVAELSSFQLEHVARLHVHVAALLNVTPDHLDRYPSFEAYAQAKGHIFRNQTEADHAVIPGSDALCQTLAGTGKGRVHRFGAQDAEVRVVDGRIVDPDTGLSVPVAALPIRGRHNHDNACAAALLARLAGVPAAIIEQTLLEFPGLPHRMVHVRRLDGVDYFDDSKATNVGAAVAALDGLSGRSGRTVLIAGGRDKGGDYAPLAARMRECGRAAVLIGEAADRIESAFAAAGVAVERAPELEPAVARARALARAGDAVLLAPACSSFDRFRSYEHRGQVFEAAVRGLPEANR